MLLIQHDINHIFISNKIKCLVIIQFININIYLGIIVNNKDKICS